MFLFLVTENGVFMFAAETGKGFLVGNIAVAIER
jgi:hypothetical protein